MSRLLKTIKILVINLVVLVVLCEIASLVIYFVWTHEFFYTRSSNRVDPMLTVPDATNRAGAQQETVQQLHPYFGFIDKAGLNHRFPYSQTNHFTNNLGFASIYQYPFSRQNPNQFIVGIFGGSVAANYSMFELEKGVLAAALKKLPGLKDKEIIVLPFAIGGYKQPQQLQVLSYFFSIGQDFDLVINIDGFNEVALSYLNYQRGSELSTPSDFIFLPMVNLASGSLSREDMTLTLDVINKKQRLVESSEALNSSRTVTGYMLRWLWARYTAQSYRQGVVSLDQSHAEKRASEQTYMQVPVGKKLTESEALEAMVAIWSRSSLMMKQLLDAKKGLYFHVVQPNQYVDTGRVMSREEKAVAFNDASPFRPGAVKGYPLLLSELA